MKPELVAALTSQLIPELEPLPAGTWRALRNVPAAEFQDFVRMRLPGSDRKNIEKRLDRLSEFETQLSSLSESGIRLVTEFEEDYPQLLHERLGDKRPSHFFAAGNLALLNVQGIGIVGSRNVNAEGAQFAAEAGREAVRNGCAVISGGAGGVDEISMRAALDSGGQTVGILADSLFRKLGAWDLESGSICLITSFTPNGGFQVRNAMARNKFIYAMSLGAVIVASDLELGGTWSGATEALKLNLTPILVRDVDLPGNRALISKGGRPLKHPAQLADVLQAATVTQDRLL